jgi:hypothetical protein
MTLETAPNQIILYILGQMEYMEYSTLYGLYVSYAFNCPLLQVSSLGWAVVSTIPWFGPWGINNYEKLIISSTTVWCEQQVLRKTSREKRLHDLDNNDLYMGTLSNVKTCTLKQNHRLCCILYTPSLYMARRWWFCWYKLVNLMETNIVNHKN